MAEHYDLMIRGGTCVLPWGEAAVDVGVRDGRIAAIGLGAGATAEQAIDAAGLHVLPGLIDPHVHLRDPGDPAIERIPTGTKAAVLGRPRGGVRHAEHQPQHHERRPVAWKQGYVERNAWCDMGLYVGATTGQHRRNSPTLELRPGVCGVKVFAGSSTGDLLIEDDETLERGDAQRPAGRLVSTARTSTGCRRGGRCSSRASRISQHAVWRDVECAFLGTRRLLALARKTGRPAHILHVSTAEELDYLAGVPRRRDAPRCW